MRAPLCEDNNYASDYHCCYLLWLGLKAFFKTDVKRTLKFNFGLCKIIWRAAECEKRFGLNETVHMDHNCDGLLDAKYDYKVIN